MQGPGEDLLRISEYTPIVRPVAVTYSRTQTSSGRQRISRETGLIFTCDTYRVLMMAVARGCLTCALALSPVGERRRQGCRRDVFSKGRSL
jgi:uncharacterized phage protein gp47/JayE